MQRMQEHLSALGGLFARMKLRFRTAGLTLRPPGMAKVPVMQEHLPASHVAGRVGHCQASKKKAHPLWGEPHFLDA